MPVTWKTTASRRMTCPVIPKMQQDAGAPNPARQAAHAAYSATGRFQ